MNLNVQRGVGLAVGILALISGITGLVMGAAQRFAALDTRLGKLESAIKALNAVTSDENYRTLIKELMAQETSRRPALRGQPVQRFGGNSYPADAGASASAPAASRGYERKDSTTHRFMCSHDGEAEVPCDVLYPPFAGAAADAPAVKVPQ